MLEFGDFQLDADRRALLRDGAPVAIQAKLFDTLVFLAENRHRVVEKQELLEAVWPQAYVEESTLFQTISALRKALGETKSDGARYVATVPGRGYRFVAPLRGSSGDNGFHSAAGANGVIPSPAESTSPKEATAPPSGLDAAAYWRRTASGLLAALLLLSAATATQWFGGREEPAPNPLRRFSIELDHAIGEAAISQNGRYLAYTRSRSAIHGFGSLWLRDLQTGETTNLVQDPVVRHVFWAPGSDFVAFGVSAGAHRSLQKAAVPGGSPVKLCDLSSGLTGGAWAPDGETILLATWNPPALHLAPARGGRPTLLLETSAEEAGARVFHPTWLPGGDGDAIIFSQAVSEGSQLEDSNLMLYRAGSGVSPIRIGEGFAPSFSMTGHLLYYRIAGGISALPFSLDSMAAIGDPFPVAEAEGPQGPTIAGDGTLAYLRVRQRGREQLVWRDRAGRKLRPAGRAQPYVAQPTLAPDGLRAVTVGGGGWGEALWIQDMAAPEGSRLTFDKEVNFSPVWSPDGRAVLFRSDRSGAGDLYIRRADGSGGARKLFGTDRSERPEAWSPDGRYIVFAVANSAGNTDLFFLERTGDGEWSEPKELVATEAREYAAEISADGRFVAYVSDESGRDEVYVEPFPGGEGKWQVSRNGARQPRWSRESGELFYVEDDTIVAVSVGTTPSFTMGRPEVLFQDRGFRDLNLNHAYDVSADGQRFLMVDWITTPKSSIEIVQNWILEFEAR